jgi:hypothetical protein
MTSIPAQEPGTPGSAEFGQPPRRAQATLITEAEPSYDEQLKARRKRYVIMMSMRVPCLILATLLYQTPWLAILVIAISIPLPWMAVLIANDRPARKRKKFVPGTINYERALTPGGREIVDSTPDDAEQQTPDGTPRGV